jgi:hypothetical protein
MSLRALGPHEGVVDGILDEPALCRERVVRPLVVVHDVGLKQLLHAPLDALEELDELLSAPRVLGDNVSVFTSNAANGLWCRCACSRESLSPRRISSTEGPVASLLHFPKLAFERCRAIRR